MRRFELLKEDRVGVRFPYNERLIAEIKKLQGRTWNAKEKRWEVPLSQLQQLVKIMGTDLQNVPREVVEAFEKRWGGDVDVHIEKGNCFVRISGKDLPVEDIDEVTSFWIEGAEHTDRYKKGQWDGMRRLLNKKKNLEFPTGLLPRVYKVLERKKLSCREEDHTEPPPEELKIKLKGIELRNYQKEAARSAYKARRGVLQMATGSGKTVVAAAMIARLKRRAIFFVHTKDLLYQAKDYFSKFLDVPVGQIGDGVVDIQPVTVATIQTTSRALGVKIPKEEIKEIEEDAAVTSRELMAVIQKAVSTVPVVFFDECHHLPASTCYSIAMKTEAACFRFGLSATPYRSDRQDLLIEAAIGPRVASIDSSHLIRKGYLVKPTIHFFPIPPTLMTRRYVQYHTVYKVEVVENEMRNRLIAQLAQRFAQQGQSVLILVTQIKHGEILSALLPEAVLLTGKDSSGFRVETLDALREGKQAVVIATTLADEGLDIPSLDVLILAGAGKSETRALQRIGRALRKTENKHSATVIDFYDQARFLEIHSRRRMEIYQTESEFDIRTEDDVELTARSRNQRDLFEGKRKQ